MTTLYTASRLRVWRECHRKHFYRYTLRIKTPSTPAMEFGTACHQALEAYFRTWKRDGAVDARLHSAFAAIDSSTLDDIDRIRLRALISAYDLTWGGEPWDVLEVEVEFTYYLGDIAIGGKIDAIIRDRETGRIFIVEHKTSTQDTSAGSPYWQKLALDTQVSVYLDGARYALDLDVHGCVYDVLKRPQHELLLATPPEKREYTIGVGCKGCGGSGKPGAIEQGRGYTIVNFGSVVETPPCPDCKGTGWKCGKDGEPQAPRPYAKTRLEDETLDEFAKRLTNAIAESSDDFLSRGVIVRLSHELPKMRQELLDTVAAMRAMAVENLAPPNPDNCFKGRDRCGYFPACSGQADISDEHLFPRSDTAHPELTAA